MQIPDPSMASDALLALGAFHLAALAQAPETQGLAVAFQPTHDALAAARAAREQAERALIAPRVAARFSEHRLERVLRTIATKAHEVDNNTQTGPALKAVFPNGLDAEIRPRGPTQFAASTTLRARLSSQPAAAAVKDATLANLDAAVADLGQKLEARKGAAQALGVARALEDGARETFCAAYDSNAGGIRGLFPRQRARQDLHFDEFRARRVSAAEEEDEAPAEIPESESSAKPA